MRLFQRINSSFFKHHKNWLITIIVLILSICIYSILIYNKADHTIKWHDGTIGWIASRELMKYTDEVKVSELSEISKIELDAETITDIRDLKYFSNLEELTLNLKNVKHMNALEKLDKLERLVLINGNMKTFEYLTELNVSTLVLKNFTLSSIEPLSEMGNLSRLEITDTFIADISSLRNMDRLSYLSLANVNSDTQISLCENGDYKEIYLSNVEINSLNSLNRYTGLTSLVLEDINLIDNMDLEFPDSLKIVALKNCGLIDFKKLLTIPGLTSLDVSGNLIQDIHDLEAFNNLKELSLANNPIYDLSPIQCLKNITSLNLSGISLDRKMLDLLSKIQLEELSVSNCNISDLDFLKGHNEIKKLDLSNNAIDNIEVLKMYRKDLKYLDISWNPISDLSPLKDWICNADIRIQDPLYEGAELNVSGINLGEIDFEKGIDVIIDMTLSKLTARSCGLRDTELIIVQLKLQFLDISDNPIDNIFDCKGLALLKEVIARDTLLDEAELEIFNFYPQGVIPLTPPGTYGISSLCKEPVVWGFFPIDYSKMDWIRVVIE